MKNTNPTELLKTIKTFMFEADFYADDINNVDEYQANKIAQSIIFDHGLEKFIDTLKSMGYKQEIKNWIILEGDSNDGKIAEYDFTGTYGEAKKYLESDLIGKYNLEKWEINDNIYSHYYNEDECNYFQIEEKEE